MRNKPNFKINMPEINAYILIIGIMSIMLLAYNLYLGFFTIGELLILERRNGINIFKICL